MVWATVSKAVQGIAAALYRNTLPHMATMRGKTGVEKVESLNKTPTFMGLYKACRYSLRERHHKV